MTAWLVSTLSAINRPLHRPLYRYATTRTYDYYSMGAVNTDIDRNVRNVHVHPVKTRMTLHCRAAWAGSSLSFWKFLKSLIIQRAYSEDRSDCVNVQTDLSLRWAHVYDGTLSAVRVPIQTSCALLVQIFHILVKVRSSVFTLSTCIRTDKCDAASYQGQYCLPFTQEILKTNKHHLNQVMK